MKTYIIFFLCLACCNCILPTNKMLLKWNIFKLKFNKTYTEPEDKHRRNIFFRNLIDFEKHNAKYRAGLVSYKKGVNKFADMTPEEFSKTLYPINIDYFPKPTHRFLFRPYVRVPEEVDWRRKGAVTAVRHQHNCGSCWTFSVAGAIEGQLFLKTGHLVGLSVQNLLDCSLPFGEDGCEGGVPAKAYQFVQQYGIDTDESYPYESRKGRCRFNPYTVGARIAGFADVEPNEYDLKIAVATIGPIAAAVNSIPLQYYHSGISDFPYCDQNVNHAVLIVGYGSENGKDYWIIKNSWGVTHGEGGYARISRNKNNYCGIASLASYPIL